MRIEKATSEGSGRKHCLAGVFALAVGLVYLLPHILFFLEAGDEYHYPFLAMPDERHYASRIQEVYDGHYAIASPDLKEYKNAPHFWQPLSEIVVASIGKLLGIQVGGLLVLSDFLFPFLLFLVIYFFAWQLTESRMLAILGACAIMMVSFVIFGPPQSLIYWLGHISWVKLNPLLNPRSSFLFSRTINPQFNIILFFLCLIGIYGACFREARGFVLLAGAALSALFYCNFFYWSYLAGGCGLFAAYALLKKDLKVFRNLVIIVMIGGLLSVPYWMSVQELSKSPYYDEAVKRTLIQFTHKPYLAKIELLCIFFFVAFCPKKDRPYLFLTAFFLGGLVCENQQVLTGRRMGPYHWSIYCQAPLMWLAMALMAAGAGQRWPGNRLIRFARQKQKSLATVAILFMFFNAVHTQVVYVYATDREKGPRPCYEKSLPVWLYYQKLDPALSWLNVNAKKDSVVLASMWASYLITAFTHCNVVATWATHSYLIPGYELWERWLLKFYFFGVPDDRVYEALAPNLDGVCELCSWLLNEEERPALRNWVEKTYRDLKQTPLQDLLAKYHVEYVLFSKEEREEYLTEQTGFDVGQCLFLRPVVKTKDVELYELMLP